MRKEVPEETFKLWEEIFELKKNLYLKEIQLCKELKDNGLTRHDVAMKKYPKIAKEFEDYNEKGE